MFGIINLLLKVALIMFSNIIRKISIKKNLYTCTFIPMVINGVQKIHFTFDTEKTRLYILKYVTRITP